MWDTLEARPGGATHRFCPYSIGQNSPKHLAAWKLWFSSVHGGKKKKTFVVWLLAFCATEMYEEIMKRIFSEMKFKDQVCKGLRVQNKKHKGKISLHTLK